MGYIVTSVLMGPQEGAGPEVETELPGRDLSLSAAQDLAHRLAERNGMVVRRIRQETRPTQWLEATLNALGTAALLALVLLG